MVDFAVDDAANAAITSRLSKSMRSRHVSMIAFGGIIGAGLFVGSSASILAAGPAVILSYLLAGAVLLLVMRMLGEMAVAYPGTGSFTEYARIALGDWAAFTTGWLYWFFWVVVVGIEAIAAAVIIEPWLGIPQWQIGLALIVAMTITNLWSARTYGEFEFWFASIKIGAIATFLIVGGAFILGIGPEGTGGFANLTAHQGFMPFGGAAVLAGVTSVIFAMVGPEIATIAAAESDAPAKNVAKMTSSLILRIVLFYVGSIFVVLCIVPWTTVVSGQSPFVAALGVIGVPGAALIMKIIVLTAVLSCLNSGLYVASRILFVLAAKGEAPQAMVALNARKVPARAIILCTVFGYLSVIASIVSPGVVFAFLINASGAVMIFIYLILAFAQVKSRRLLEAAAPERLSLKMWLFPWLSYAAIAAMIAILLAMALTESLASQFYMSVVSLAFVLIVHMIVKRRKARLALAQ